MPEPNRVCQRCSRPFYTRPSEIKRGRGLFCSKDCKFATQSEQRTGVEPVYNQTRVRRGRSQANIAFICDWCGQTFWVRGASLRQQPHKFCNRICFQDWKRANRHTEADTEPASPPHPTENKYLVEYDPQTKQLRNKD